MCDCCDYIAARGGRPDDQTLVAEFERDWRRRVRALVSEGGWQTVSVDGSRPGFCYTIGLWTHGHAELCVFGLDAHEATPLLDAIACGVTTGEVRLDDADEVDLGGWRLRAFRLPNPDEVVLRANVFYRRKSRDSVPVLQLVYPDVHGTWPWEPGCHLDAGCQPMPGTFRC